MGSDISLLGRVSAQITPEQGGWVLWFHGGIIRRLDEFDQAVRALRDYLLEWNASLDEAD